MFKEVVFELSGGQPRSKHAAYFFTHPELTARMQILHTTAEVAYELTEVTGEPEPLAAFRDHLASGAEPPELGVEIVSTTARSIQFVSKWPRPRPGDRLVSMEFLLHDVVGPDAIFQMRIERGRAEIKAAGPDGERLLRFFNEVRRRLEARFTIRLLRMGELRPGWDHPETAPRPAGLRDADRELVAFALASGYYDNPKRCGVRELGDALGCSKSVIARRLRTIERRALESLVVKGESCGGAPAHALPASAAAPPDPVPAPPPVPAAETLLAN